MSKSMMIDLERNDEGDDETGRDEKAEPPLRLVSCGEEDQAGAAHIAKSCTSTHQVGAGACSSSDDSAGIIAPPQVSDIAL